MKRRRLAAVLGLGLLALLLWPEAPPGPTGAWMAAAGLTPHFETVEGLRVRYLRAGQGPAVVLIHGLASSIVTWRDVMPALARDHDVVALDLPGFGGSDQPPDLSPGAYPREVLGLMGRLGIARASIVGNSMGGMVAVQVAVEAPERVERLVLIDAAGFNQAPADRPAIVRLMGSPVSAVARHLPVARSFVRMALRQVFFDAALVTPERVEEYAAPFFRPGALASMRSLLSSRSRDARGFSAALARVRTPTLVLWGQDDAWIPVAHADLFAAALPGARTVVLPRCGHMPQEERPADTLRLIAGFLPAAP